MSYAISIHVSEKEMMKLVRIKEYVHISLFWNGIMKLKTIHMSVCLDYAKNFRNWSYNIHL